MKSFYKNFYRTIRQSLGRYLAILGITFLGSIMFSGLLSTSPNMLKTSNSYFEKTNLFDIKMVSSTMFSSKDIEKISKQSAIKKVLKTTVIDSQAKIDDGNYTLRLITLPKFDNQSINKLTLVKGRMPKNKNEVVIVEPVEGLKDSKIKIDDNINLSVNSYLKSNHVKIVGLVHSPEYFSNGSISSSVGKGKVDYIIYGEHSILTKKIYNQLFLTIKPNYIHNKNIEHKQYSRKIKILIKNLKRKNFPNNNHWVISDRAANIAYVALKNDINSISGISKIFPIIFIIVAAFVAMTTMSRLIEEERIIIGTFKSLGYSNTVVLFKYLLYALSASILGSVIGAIIGLKIIPDTIWDTYSIKYSLPNLTKEINWQLALISVLGLTFVTVTATFFSVRNIVNKTTSRLLIPQAPIAGKRVIIERFTPLWRRLSFLYKVTIRNVFLDKKRMWMTILGVTGCMMLLVTAFGLRDSLQNFTKYQYKEIFKYDATFGINSRSRQLENFFKQNESNISVLGFQNSSIEIEKDNFNYTINLAVPNSNQNKLSSFIKLYNNDSNKKLDFGKDSAVISQNIAQKIGVKVGDKVTFNLYGDNLKRSVKITGITTNYQENYLYLSPKLYKELYKKDPTYTNYYLKFEKDNKDKKDLYKKLRAIKSVSYINKKQTIISQINDGLQGMNMIVIILIIAAGLLAFLVLYNINNINVSERTREISTLKVLGFKNNEVEAYIFREIILLTITGCCLGLVVGYFTFLSVIRAIGTDFYVFNESIHLSTFIYSILITFFFAVFINIFMIIKLRNINMLDSLKSVD